MKKRNAGYFIHELLALYKLYLGKMWIEAHPLKAIEEAIVEIPKHHCATEYICVSERYRPMAGDKHEERAKALVGRFIAKIQDAIPSITQKEANKILWMQPITVNYDKNTREVEFKAVAIASKVSV